MSIDLDNILKVTESRPNSFRKARREPGTVLAVEADGLVVACGEGSLLLTGLQVPGKRPLPVAEFLRGFEIRVGDQLRS